MFKIFCLIFGYGIGCIQTAYYVGRIFGKIDIRDHGSGNAGTTNVTRVIGLKAGILTFVMDVFKAFFVYILCSYLFKGSGSFYTYVGEGANGYLPGLYAGIGLVLGHNFPVQLKFKGGKGIASTFGIFLCISLKLALMSFAVGLVVVFSTHFISAAALTVCIIYPMMIIASKFNLEETIICVVFSVMAFIRHKANIKRLMSGTENKFKIKKKGV